MNPSSKTPAELLQENAELRARLVEAEETLRAIRAGEVDALVMGEEVYTLKGAETPYRLLIESMNEGAATLAPDGTILYCNSRFAEMVATPAEQAIGSSLWQCVVPAQQPIAHALVATAQRAGARAELTFSAPTGPGLPVLLSLRPIHRDSESIGVVVADLTERKAHEQKLLQLNQKLDDTVRQRTAELQAIFDTAPIGLAITDDPQGLHIRGNPANEQMLGLGRGEELSLAAPQQARYRPLQDGRELSVEQLPMQRAIRGETVTGQVIEILRPDGQTVTLYSSAAPLRDEQGRPCGAVGAFMDITRLKQSEVALSRSQKKFSELVERAPFGIYLVDSQFRIAHMNTASQTGAFRNVRPVIGRPLTEAMRILWPEPVAAEIIGHFRHTLETGEPYYSPPFINPRHDVKIVEAYEWELHRTTLEDGQYGVICYYFDSTKLREAERALRESEQRLKHAQQIAKVGSWEWDIQSGALWWSEQVYGQMGEQPDCFAPTYEAFRQRVHPDDRAAYEAALQRALDGTSPFDLELRMVRRDGTACNLHTRAEIVLGPDGRPLSMVGVCVDITERKQAEEALAAAHKQVQSIIDNATAIIYAFDLEGRFVMANTAVADLLNSTPEQMIGKRRHEFMPKEDADWHEANDRQVIETGKALEFEEYSQIKGRSITWLTTKFPLRDAQGRIYAVAGISADVSERKQAEEALRKSEALALSEKEFRLLAEAMPQIVWATRADGWNTYFNRQWVDYTGLTLEESYGHGWNRPFHPDDRQRAWEAWQNAVNNRATYALECRLRRADGTYRWWLVRGVPVLDEKGNVVKWFGTCTDINDFKEAEEAMREAGEERLRLVLDATSMGTFEVDLRTGEGHWNAVEFELLGLKPGDAPSVPATFFRYLHPDDEARVQAQWAEATQTGVLNTEFRIVRADGQVRWLAGLGRFAYAGMPDGSAPEGKREPIRFLGVNFDITQRKQMEEEVRRHVEELRATNEELNRFNEAMVGRELRMIELKQEINALCAQLGQPLRYGPEADRPAGPKV
ncbi:MAG: PAS domain S-box protein [Verrucomicrobia bacterium]|nr:PAS domain S-box protein [Verrucomicrobiota bacterium]